MENMEGMERNKENIDRIDRNMDQLDCMDLGQMNVRSHSSSIHQVRSKSHCEKEGRNRYGCSNDMAGMNYEDMFRHRSRGRRDCRNRNQMDRMDHMDMRNERT